MPGPGAGPGSGGGTWRRPRLGPSANEFRCPRGPRGWLQAPPRGVRAPTCAPCSVCSWFSLAAPSPCTCCRRDCPADRRWAPPRGLEAGVWRGRGFGSESGSQVRGWGQGIGNSGFSIRGVGGRGWWLSPRTGDRCLVPGPCLQGLKQSGEWEPGRPLAGTCALPVAWVRGPGLWSDDLPRRMWRLTPGGACSRASVGSVASPVGPHSYRFPRLSPNPRLQPTLAPVWTLSLFPAALSLPPSTFPPNLA